MTPASGSAVAVLELQRCYHGVTDSEDVKDQILFITSTITNSAIQRGILIY